MRAKGLSRYLLSIASLGLIYLLSQKKVDFLKPFRKVCDGDCVHRELNSTKQPLFQIYTPGCIVPYVDTYHPGMIGYRINEPRKVVCSEKDPLTEATGLMLYMYPDRIWQYGLVSEADLNCSYQGIVRIQQDPKNYNRHCDRRIEYKDEVPITEKATFIDEDGIYVTCRDKKNATSEPFYKNVHYFIQPRRVTKKRKKQEEKGPRGSEPDQLSVIIMGLDSMARNNFVRHMPKSFHYITHELKAIDMRGFVRIGGNTYPNLVALLSGLRYEDIEGHTCHPRRSSKYDDCPFLWKNFSSNGYATAYAEDSVGIGTFRFNKVGFVLEPTDYYLVPYFMISENKISHNAGWRGQNGAMCQGGKLTHSVLYDYSLEIAESLRDIPYFGHFWTGAMTHDKIVLSTAADQPALEYLKKLNDGGYLEHTILFFMSDHGLRYGSFKGSYGGLVEMNMPHLMIVLPQWFKDKYPEAVKNLEINSRRLTTALDVHATLHDINNRAYADLSKSFVGKKFGQSLFKVIPEERTCNSTSIMPTLCPCQNTTKADLKDPLLLGSINRTLTHLNQGLRNFPACAQLTLGKVLDGIVHSPSDNTKPSRKNTIFNTYDVKFTAEPGGVKVESSVLYDNFTQTYTLATEVSRMNQEANQGRCIEDDIYKKFCFCKT